MANPQPTPYIRLSQEYALALRLYGRLNGTEWEVMLSVMDATWGHQRKEAPLGAGDFAQNSLKSNLAIRKALKNLVACNLLIIVTPEKGTSPRVWRIQKDWQLWPWKDETRAWASATIKNRFKPLPDAEPVAYTETASDLARELRGLLTAGNPGANVPTDRPGERAWDRWCATIQGILDRSDQWQHSAETISNIMIWANRDAFWGPKMTGQKAPTFLKRNYDQLVQKTFKTRS